MISAVCGVFLGVVYFLRSAETYRPQRGNISYVSTRQLGNAARDRRLLVCILVNIIFFTALHFGLHWHLHSASKLCAGGRRKVTRATINLHYSLAPCPSHHSVNCFVAPCLQPWLFIALTVFRPDVGSGI